MSTAFDVMLDAEETPSFDELVEQAPNLAPEDVARQLLLRLAALEAHQTRVKAQANRIANVYGNKLASIGDQITQARDMLRNCVDRNQGKVISWPDLGSVYLTKRKPAVRVLEPEGFKAWALEHGHTKETVDETSAKKAALESVLTDGVLPDWGEFVAESKGVVVKFAHNETVPF